MKYFLLILIAFSLQPFSFGQKKINQRLLTKQAPDSFLVKFETSKGMFIVKSKRIWSPKAVDRFYQLVCSHYYDGASIFRVQKDYVAQFGISNDSTLYNFWNKHKVPDEPVVENNRKGTISFARADAETRTTQLFINLHDNLHLNTVNANGIIGYPVIAEIIYGKNVPDAFFGEYGFKPAEEQDSISRYGNSYLIKHYPKLDYISKTDLLKFKRLKDFK